LKTPVIQTFELTKVFGRTIAVNKLNLQVNKGEIFGFLGPNGAGKTTTIKMLIGALFPTAGRIEILGQDINGKEKINIHKRIGYVPEHPTYFQEMTAEGLLNYVGAIFHLPKQEIIATGGFNGGKKSRNRKIFCGDEAANRDRASVDE
jgi:ABC-2 type transport system ATP-binding protein